MKYSNVYSALIILCLLSFSDCSKSNDPAPPSIIGTWKATSTSISGCNVGTNNKAETACTSNCTQIAFANSAVTITDTGSSPIVGTYTINGTTLTVSVPGQTIVYQFSVTSTTLTLTLTPPSLNGGPNNDPGCIATTKAIRQ